MSGVWREPWRTKSHDTQHLCPGQNAPSAPGQTTSALHQSSQQTDIAEGKSDLTLYIHLWISGKEKNTRGFTDTNVYGDALSVRPI